MSITASCLRADASGWVGRLPLNTRINQTNEEVTCHGGLGMANVDIHEQYTPGGGNIWGSLDSASGFASVSVSVATDGKNSHYDGFLGNNNLHLDEMAQPDGSHWIVGQMGQTNVSLTRVLQGDHYDYTGTLNSWGQSQFVNVRMSGVTEGLRAEVLTPLLTILA